jgi:hypothetical protein
MSGIFGKILAKNAKNSDYWAYKPLFEILTPKPFALNKKISLLCPLIVYCV